MRNRWHLGANRKVKVEWDFEDRLVKVVKSDGAVVENTYDVDGVLVRTVVNSSATDLLVDTSGGLSHVVAEIDGSGSVSALYVRAGDMLLEEIRGGVAKMYEADGLGSVRSLLDTSGARTDTWTYEAFGTTVSSTGTSTNPYRFAGERLVDSVGMYQNRARWLDTRTGRFVSLDPMLDVTRSPYGYGSSSPVSMRDPTGQMSLVEVTFVLADAMVIGAVVGGAGAAAYSFAKTGRITEEAIQTGMLLGAGGGALGVLAPGVAAALGIAATAVTVPDLARVFADPNASVGQKTVAGITLVTSIFGAAAGARWATSARGNPGGITSNGQLVLGSGAGGKPQATVVRVLKRGETVKDLINEFKTRTFETGDEHALVVLESGERIIVKGGPEGMNLDALAVRRILGHTHPYDRPPSGPSDPDIAALETLGQMTSYLLEHGVLYKFGRKSGP